MILPNRLSYESLIGIIAPASPKPKEEIDNDLSTFTSLGFKVKKGRHLYDSLGYLAGEDKVRAEDFNDMYHSEDVDAIVCYRGGYGTSRIMPYINFPQISKKIKILCGFSDITILLNYMAQRYNTVTFHGPMISSNFLDKATHSSFISTLMEGYKPYSIENPEGFKLESSSDKKAEGRLAGGNLSLICSSLGTPYEINFKNKIIFIEDVGESPYAIDRMLTTLIQSKSLTECNGIILGQFTDCEASDKEKSFKLQEVFEDRLLPLNKPILYNFMSGHDYPKLTLPIGAKAQLDGKNKILNITEPVVK